MISAEIHNGLGVLWCQMLDKVAQGSWRQFKQSVYKEVDESSQHIPCESSDIIKRKH